MDARMASQSGPSLNHTSRSRSMSTATAEYGIGRSSIWISASHSSNLAIILLPAIRPLPPRSEERRVGKECRSRWSRYHKKKKKKKSKRDAEQTEKRIKMKRK